MMVRFIDAHRHAYGVEPICDVVPIAPSRYYELRARQRDPARRPPRVRGDGRLSCRIRRVWPPKLALRGFQFQLLAGVEQPSRAAAGPPQRDVTAILQWVDRSVPYSPQPYEQLAQVLAATGDDI